MTHDRDEVFTKRMNELRGAPDRRDWEDVTGRVASVADQRETLRSRGRIVRRSLAVAGVTGLAAILGILFIALPKEAATPPAVSIERIPAVPVDQLPQASVDLGRGEWLAGAKLLSTSTSAGDYTVWRIAHTSGHSDVVFGPDGPVSGGPACFLDGGPVPEDPPGTPERVVVPDFHGVQLGEVKVRLAELGLVPGRLFDVDRKGGVTDDFYVTGTGQAGVPITQGSEVELLVSRNLPRNVSPKGYRDLRWCQAGGPQHAVTALFAVSPQVDSVSVEWPDGRRDEAVIQNQVAFILFPPNDCAHPDPPKIVARDAEGNELRRLSADDRDADWEYALGRWETSARPICRGPKPPTPQLGDITTELSVLRAGVPADRTIRARFRSLFDQSVPTVLRRGAVVNGLSLFAGTANTSGGGRICLVDFQEPSVGTSENAVTCVAPSYYSTEFLLTERNRRGTASGDRSDVMGLALDGFDTAEAGGKRVRIQNNVFLIPDVESNAEVVITGPAGRRAARPHGRTGGRLEPTRVPLPS